LLTNEHIRMFNLANEDYTYYKQLLTEWRNRSAEKQDKVRQQRIMYAEKRRRIADELN